MALLWSNRITKPQADIIIRRSDKLSTEPDWAMFLFDLESSLNPFIENPYGCYSWLQFCADYSGANYKTIQGRRYYFSDMKKMTADELLNLSFDYLDEQQENTGRFASYHDMYFSILYPVAVGKPDDYVLNTKTNPLFDLNKNGTITVGEVKEYLDNRVRAKVPTEYWNTFFKKKSGGNYIREKSYGEHSLSLV